MASNIVSDLYPSLMGDDSRERFCFVVKEKELWQGLERV